MADKNIALRANTPEVQQFIDVALLMTQAAAEYAGEQYSDPEVNGMLAEIQVITGSLQTALQQTAQRSASRPFAPPEPVEPDPEPEAKPGTPIVKSGGGTIKRR